jgi:hypothetical protein
MDTLGERLVEQNDYHHEKEKNTWSDQPFIDWDNNTHILRYNAKLLVTFRFCERHAPHL